MDKKKTIKIISLGIGIICLGVLIFSVVKIASWFIDNSKTEKLETEIKEITPIVEVIDSEKTEMSYKR